MEVTTIEELQEKSGLLDTNKTGIIYRAVAQSDLQELLSKYIETADNHMYYSYGNHVLLRKYEHAYIMDNLNYIESAIYYALKSEEYNLKTLIDTTELDYDPLDNYVINETIVTSTTISDKFIKGTQQDKRSISEIKTTGNNSDTKQYGAINETGSNETTYGQVNDNTTQTTNYGERTENSTNTLTKSPYNDAQYHPKERTTVNDVKNAVTDSVNTLEQIDQHTDKVSTSKLTQARTDSNTGSNSTTQAPYNITDAKGERTDTNNRNGGENKKRNVKGRYGYTTTQSLIDAERKLADLNIAERIIQIVLRTICNNVLYMM